MEVYLFHPLSSDSYTYTGHPLLRRIHRGNVVLEIRGVTRPTPVAARASPGLIPCRSRNTVTGSFREMPSPTQTPQEGERPLSWGLCRSAHSSDFARHLREEHRTRVLVTAPRGPKTMGRPVVVAAAGRNARTSAETPSQADEARATFPSTRTRRGCAHASRRMAKLYSRRASSSAGALYSQAVHTLGMSFRKLFGVFILNSVL